MELCCLSFRSTDKKNCSCTLAKLFSGGCIPDCIGCNLFISCPEKKNVYMCRCHWWTTRAASCRNNLILKIVSNIWVGTFFIVQFFHSFFSFNVFMFWTVSMCFVINSLKLKHFGFPKKYLFCWIFQIYMYIGSNLEFANTWCANINSILMVCLQAYNVLFRFFESKEVKAL